MVIYEAFSKLSQSTSKDRATVTNLMDDNTKITKKMAQYANSLSIKDTDNSALQRVVYTLQGNIKNLKDKLS